MDLPKGVTLKVMSHGEERYYASARCKGRPVMLGWYTTARKAVKAIQKVEES
jgi:hypothetical protein